jgi:hypothetical protein
VRRHAGFAVTTSPLGLFVGVVYFQQWQSLGSNTSGLLVRAMLQNSFCVCAALGYGQIHVIKSADGKYKQSSRISQGAEKWLDVHVWSDTKACIDHAKRQGRQILVTHFDDRAIPISVCALANYVGYCVATHEHILHLSACFESTNNL